MITCKRRDIDEIIDNNKRQAVFEWFKGCELVGKSPRYATIATYRPRGANWVYHVGIVLYEGRAYKGVFKFGKCLAVEALDIW